MEVPGQSRVEEEDGIRMRLAGASECVNNRNTVRLSGWGDVCRVG